MVPVATASSSSSANTIANLARTSASVGLGFLSNKALAAKIIAGVGTLSSARALRWMGHNVPGVYVPENLLARIEKAKDQKAEGLDILVETIKKLRAMEGIAGVHLMGHHNEAVLAEAISRSGIRNLESHTLVS